MLCKYIKKKRTCTLNLQALVAKQGCYSRPKHPKKVYYTCTEMCLEFKIVDGAGKKNVAQLH